VRCAALPVVLLVRVDGGWSATRAGVGVLERSRGGLLDGKGGVSGLNGMLV
jgi:hypothetical protein